MLSKTHFIVYVKEEWPGFHAGHFCRIEQRLIANRIIVWTGYAAFRDEFDWVI